MNFESVTLSEFALILGEGLFEAKFSAPIIPDNIISFSNELGLNVHIEKIEDWENFEYGTLDFDHAMFYKLGFGGISPMDEGKVYILSDEGYSRDEVFVLNANDFFEFALYSEERYGQEFFQPFDYIIYFENARLLRIIHHEGHLLIIGRDA